jgi:hypothetical protein
MALEVDARLMLCCVVEKNARCRVCGHGVIELERKSGVTCGLRFCAWFVPAVEDETVRVPALWAWAAASRMGQGGSHLR